MQLQVWPNGATPRRLLLEDVLTPFAPPSDCFYYLIYNYLTPGSVIMYACMKNRSWLKTQQLRHRNGSGEILAI